MRLSSKPFKQFAETYFEGKNAIHNYISGMQDIGIPRIFYCEWIEDEKDKKTIQKNYPNCCFNHRIGLPTRKWEGDAEEPEEIPVPLTGTNRRQIENYNKYKKYSENKCRGSGTTEILTIRWMIFKYGVLNEMANRKCVIVPGTSGKLTLEISTRIKAICDKIPQIYDTIPTSIRPMDFSFKTGGRIVLTSATADAIRGWENVGDIILEEVAHWDMVDDMPVYNSSQAVHTKTQCHVLHSTTPRQKRGFYYNLIWDETAKSDFYKNVTNWREVVGLPVPLIEDLQKHIEERGDITMKDLKAMRKQLVELYRTDPEYKMWYNTFERQGVRVFYHLGKLIPIEELVDVSIPILDINSIIRDSITFRPEYDQELDNMFIATNSRAIGDFVEEDFDPIDLRSQIDNYEEAYEYDKEHHTGDELMDLRL
jgi:hypothetical protein